MTADIPDKDSRRRIFAPAAETEADDAVWPMARMLMENGVPPGRMALIRWDRLPSLLGTRWPEVEGKVARLVQSLARKTLGAGAACARFDDRSVLLVLTGRPEAEPGTAVEAVAATVRQALFGALRRDEMIEVWVVRGAQGTGLECEPAAGAAAPPPDAASPPAGPPPAPHDHHHHIVLGDTDFSYFPLSEVRRNFVFFYVCEPFWTLPDGSMFREDDLTDQFSSPRHIVALDCELLRNAAEVMDDVMEHDRMAQVLIPVHYSTLAGESYADRYAGEVRKVAYELKERAYFEIVGIPPDLPPARLAEIVEGLRRLCRGVCVRVSFGWPSLRTLAEARVFAVGLGLRADNRREAEIIPDLETFAAEAAAVSLRSYVHGIRTTSLGVAATCSGIDFVGTEGLAATLDGCALDDYMIKPIDLYKRIARKRT